jgi:hypothetical protein
MFRPCIDLHNGVVKQIVGTSLRDDDGGAVVENFASTDPPAAFAALYARLALTGAHVVKLGPGNDAAARSCAARTRGLLQVGGGVTAETAAAWLAGGFSHVIVTSFLFGADGVDWDRLALLAAQVPRERLVIDLSCAARPTLRGGGGFWGLIFFVCFACLFVCLFVLFCFVDRVDTRTMYETPPHDQSPPLKLMISKKKKSKKKKPPLSHEIYHQSRRPAAVVCRRGPVAARDAVRG